MRSKTVQYVSMDIKSLSGQWQCFAVKLAGRSFALSTKPARCLLEVYFHLTSFLSPSTKLFPVDIRESRLLLRGKSQFRS